MADGSTPSGSSQSSVLRNPLVLSILITETAERIAYYGFRAILVLYFTDGLQFTESTAVSLCAGTVALAYFSPLVGATLADSFWGRYQTIWKFSCLYCLGLCLLTLGAYSVVWGASTTTAGDSETTMLEDEVDTKDEKEDSSKENLIMERFLTFSGLLLVCTGTGGIKPCVSAFGADQVALEDTNEEKKTEERGDPMTEGSAQVGEHSNGSLIREERIREFFNSFYFCINMGALGSFAIIPLIRARWGFGAAFLVPTLFMMAALLVFASKRNSYKHRKRDESQPSLYRILQVCLKILKTRLCRSKLCTTVFSRIHSSSATSTLHFSVPSDDPDAVSIGETNTAISTTRETLVFQEAAQALHLLPLMLFFPIFWMLYDQQGSVWTLQATRLDLHGLEPEQLNVLNPLEIMILIPLFDLKIYPWLENRGFNIQPLRRMEYGMFLASVSFLTSALLEYYVQSQPPLSVSVAWQIPQITLLTVAEILLNVTGLEFAYNQAPANMQALILALYLCMTSIGDGLGALLYASIFADLSLATSMLICAISMLINLLFFSRVVQQWKPYYFFDTDGLEEITNLELKPVNHFDNS